MTTQPNQGLGRKRMGVPTRLGGLGQLILLGDARYNDRADSIRRHLAISHTREER
jgi:hypothetical protein